MNWQQLAVLALGVGVMVAIARAVGSRAVFRIRIKGGIPTLAGGKVDGAFLDDLAEICRRDRIDRGTVRGVVEGKRVALAFSKGIPKPARQHIRNVWNLESRPAPRGRS